AYSPLLQTTGHKFQVESLKLADGKLVVKTRLQAPDKEHSKLTERFGVLMLVEKFTGELRLDQGEGSLVKGELIKAPNLPDFRDSDHRVISFTSFAGHTDTDKPIEAVLRETKDIDRYFPAKNHKASLNKAEEHFGVKKIELSRQMLLHV